MGIFKKGMVPTRIAFMALYNQIRLITSYRKNKVHHCNVF